MLERPGRPWSMVESHEGNRFTPAVDDYIAPGEGRYLAMMSNPCNPTGVTRRGPELEHRAAGKVLKDFGGRVPTTLWIVPPTKMDAHELMEEGYYSTDGLVGARTEIPGCSLCMGNQARVRDGATVVSTSTRKFPNRMGKDSNVYLASAELSAISAIMGRLPTVAEYMDKMQGIKPWVQTFIVI